MLKTIIFLLLYATLQSCISRSPRVVVTQALEVDEDQKLLVFIDGVIGYLNFVDLEGADFDYCGLENFKLKQLALSKSNSWNFIGAKIEVPNSAVHRYTMFLNEDFSVFCDTSFSNSHSKKSGKQKTLKSMLERHAGDYFEVVK